MSRLDNPLYQGMKLGEEQSKIVMEVILNQLRDLEEKAEDVVYVQNNRVIDFQFEINKVIGYLESHIIDEYGEDFADELDIDTTKSMEDLIIGYDDDDDSDVIPAFAQFTDDDDDLIKPFAKIIRKGAKY